MPACDYPKISIVTPSYNQAPYLEQTILSVLEQQYPNLEYFIIDGGSTDGSIDIIKKYGAHITRWVSEPDSGQSEAINKGFTMCSGDIVGWLNSDDYYEKNVFARIAGIFENENIHILNGDCRLVKENGVAFGLVCSKKLYLNRLLHSWVPYSIPPQPAIFFRRACLEKVGLLDESLHYGMDYDLWLRLCTHYRFDYVPGILANYRFHEQSKSVSGDGFAKFIPEWHSVRDRYLHAQPLHIRLSYKMSWYYFKLKSWFVDVKNFTSIIPE